jgi:orotidine-5'-phosphate decarboxylase
MRLAQGIRQPEHRRGTREPSTTVAELIVALDMPDADAALNMVDRIGPDGTFYKVGFELFTREGPEIVRELANRSKRIFLDLKFHDIPNTVAGAASVARRLGVELLTVHASGGPGMIRAAREAVEGSATRVLAVTVLTSLSADDLSHAWGRDVRDSEEDVGRLASMAIDAGAHGVVSAAGEAAMLRRLLGPDVLLVTPGIRMQDDEHQDQARVSGPAEAVRSGADFLVVGRPITRAVDPAAAHRSFTRAMSLQEQEA